MKDFKNLRYEKLLEILADFNKPEYVAKNIYSWVYKRNISDFNQMTDIAKNLRSYFIENYELNYLKEAKREISRDKTVKFLFELKDSNTIESVLIPHDGRLTICISSQVGCKMGCTFCQTSKQGFLRNLETSEIVNQIHTVNKIALTELKFLPDDSEYRVITNIVFMGMGEPLDNMDNVIEAIDIVSNDNAYGFGKRKITVSTCGLANKMIEFKERCGAKLALSLNSVNDNFRDQIMPINQKFNIEKLIETINKLNLKTHDFVTIEYILFKGLNDSLKEAEILSKLLINLPIKVNLLYYNSHSDSNNFKSPSDADIFKFNELLNSKGIIARVRESRGKDISAACGQLKSRS